MYSLVLMAALSGGIAAADHGGAPGPVAPCCAAPAGPVMCIPDIAPICPIPWLPDRPWVCVPMPQMPCIPDIAPICNIPWMPDLPWFGCP